MGVKRKLNKAYAAQSGITAGGNLLKAHFANKAAKEQAAAQLKRSQDMLDKAQEADLAAKRERGKYGLDASYRNLRSLVLQDPTSDFLRQESMRQDANQTGSLKAGGARALLGGLGAVAQATQDRMLKIAQDEQIRKQQGLQVVGNAEQRVAEERLSDARGDLTLARAQTAEAQQGVFGAQDLERARIAAKNQAIVSGLQGAATAAYGVYGNDGRGFEGADPELMKLFMKDGGIMRGKTPGPFSHEENPIDIVQDGEKIGEMTGGEGVVSPEDLGKLEQLAGEGKSPLHSFVMKLIRKLERNGEQ